MSFYRSSNPPPPPTGITEFEILKARHKFLREDGDEDETPSARPSNWDDQLAKKYYDSLYREFAICDLKHFKTGNFSLRWRTEDEVIDGTGETTCGNSRCEFHHGSSQYRDASPPPLTTLELPFGYEEHGEQKSALVKVVLCPGCVRKLMWKRTKEKEREQRVKGEGEGEGEGSSEGRRREGRAESRREKAGIKEGLGRSEEGESKRRKRRDRSMDGEDRSRHSRRRDRSRSRSPHRKEPNQDRQKERRGSPGKAA